MTSTSNIVPFSFEGSNVRAGLIKGEPYLAASEVAVALGYADPDKAIRTHCKALKRLNSAELAELGIGDPPPSGLIMIPERDVYRLIMRSRLPHAERFEEWVVAEVLPSLRKTGAFVVPSRMSDADIARLLGGTKGIIIKRVTEIVEESEARMFLAIASVRDEARDALVKISQGYDQTQAVVLNKQPMVELLDQNGLSIRKKGVVQKFTSAVRKWLSAEAAKPTDEVNKVEQPEPCKVTGRWLFRRQDFARWLTLEGHNMIRQINDTRTGQKSLNFDVIEGGKRARSKSE